jgi:hypothetical protein
LLNKGSRYSPDIHPVELTGFWWVHLSCPIKKYPIGLEKKSSREDDFSQKSTRSNQNSRVDFFIWSGLKSPSEMKDNKGNGAPTPLKVLTSTLLKIKLFLHRNKSRRID